jgi:phosphatidate cytidylyltransferase
VALNKAVFKTRALTALVFVAVMLVGLLWNFGSFLTLFTIVHFGCWYEYLNIVEKIHNKKFSFNYRLSLMFGAASVALCFLFFNWFIDGYSLVNFFIPAFGIVSFIYLLASFFQMKQDIFSKQSFAALAGVLYISFPIGMLFWLYKMASFPNGTSCSLVLDFYLILFIVVSIWINDTMQYIVGSLIGKTPFSKISPKKTWEGTIGGIILCIVAMGLVAKFITPFKEIALHHWLIIAALCSIFGTLGDLLESKIKRTANIKDSGSFMPGHGGFLDRFDSILVAAPAVWLYFKFFVA